MIQNKLTRRQWLVVLTAFLPLILLACFYEQLPQKVPMHWNLDGGVRYEDKIQLWMLGGITLIMAPFFLLMPKIDPKGKNFKRFENHYDLFMLVMNLFLTGMMGMIISESFTPGRIPISTVVCGSVGLLFLFLGNMLPKVRSNYTMGLRTPWALANEEVWNRTQRLGGKTMFSCGLLVLIGAFLLEDMPLFWLLMISLIIAMGIPSVMSYIWYRQLTGEGSENAQ